MKQSLYIFIIPIIFSHISCYGIIASGSISNRSITPNMISIYPLNYAFDQQDYTPGGLTFTYPSGWFTAPPVIFITIQQITTHATSFTYSAEVSSNSSTQTTITVYQITQLGIVNEAPTGAVKINLLALAMPSTNPFSDA